MPELPEVETIVRSLRQAAGPLTDCCVTSAEVLWPRTLANLSPDEFKAQISGQTIQEVSRRGKFLAFTLTHDTLLVHLRMSGDLRLENSSGSDGSIIPHQKHDRLVLNFANECRLAFNDPRKFGRVWLVKDAQEVLGDLGPEPLDPDLSPEIFHSMLTSRSRQLKPLLMDQNFLAGLGNIYTDEALHLAKLHPLRSSNQLNRQESGRLLNAIRAILEEGIRRNGASIDWAYRGGEFQNHFRVYGRTGEACPECGATIQRLVVGQRSTHICPKCQSKI